jgi:hypothetical protein
MKEKLFLIFIGIMILITVVTNVMVFSNYLIWPTSCIEQRLLSRMPLGSTEDEVLEFIARHENWEVFSRPGVQLPRPGTIRYHATTIRAYMGNYRGMLGLRTHVDAFWRFDEDGKLFEVVVTKDMDVI